MIPSSTSLFYARRFWPLFWTQFFGAFNDNFLKTALVVAITYQGAHVFGVPPSQMVALGGGVFILPFFLFSATAGQLADRHEKTTIIRWVKLSEIVIMAIAAIGFVSGAFEFTLVSLFLMGTHSAFFGPIKYSILPQHLSPDELVKGNAYVEAGTFLAILLGTIAGTSLISIPSIGGWLVSGGLFVFAVFGLLTCLRIPSAPAVQPTLQVEWNIFTPTKRILAETRQNRIVHESIRGISWFWFFGATMLSLLPPLCKELIQASPDVVTFFLALFSVGIAVGSILTERLSRGTLELGCVPFGSLGMTVFTVALGASKIPQLNSGGILNLLALSEGRWISFHLLMVSICSGFFTVPLYTLMQQRSAPETRSRVIAANNIVNALYMVVASVLLMGAFAFGMTIPAIFVALGVMNLAVAFYSYLQIPEFCHRLLSLMLSRLMYRFEIFGTEHIPHEGPAVLICNHVSFVDWMLISSAIRRPVRYVMDHNFEKGLIMKGIVRGSKIITIAPVSESVTKLRSAFEKIDEALRAGDLVVIFPEGEITRDGNLVRFKKGVERILASNPVPVIPMALHGMWGSLFSRKGGAAIRKLPRRFRARVRLQIGEPLKGGNLTASELQKRVEDLLRSSSVS